MKWKFDKEERNMFIENFFHNHEIENIDQDMISALDSTKNIVTKELQKNRRMLLYVCHFWKLIKESEKMSEEDFFDKMVLLDRLWEQMRLTYNMKYPEREITEEELNDVREKIGQIQDNELTEDNIEEKFGDKVNLFYFGFYTTSLKRISDAIGKT